MLAAGGSRLGPGHHLLIRRGPGAGDRQRGERGQLLQHLPPRVAPRQVTGQASVVGNSAVKGSIGFTIGFHNHGEGPY